MPVSTHTLKLIQKHGYFTQVQTEKLAGVLMWIIDRKFRIVDLTPEVAAYFNCDVEDLIGRSTEELVTAEDWASFREEYQRILECGEPSTIIKWSQLPAGWRKFIQTLTPLGNNYIMAVSHDITDVDPLSNWLMKVDIVRRRLNLGASYGDQTITLQEWMVLHRIARNHSHRQIADELHISPDTVRYRISRIREKLGVNSASAMWEEIYGSGLIHLLALPFGLDSITADRADLLELDPSTTEKPSHGA